MDPIIIIGSGLAGVTVAREFRKLDRATPVVMLTADHGDFYSKPNLSNAFATGKTAPQLVANPREALAAQLAIEIRPQNVVRSIELESRRVVLADGVLAWSQLVLAVGAQPIRLPIAGSAASRILSVNNLDDYARFRDALAGDAGPVRRVALLGAGLIGCEFANDLRGAGFDVDVFDLAPQPLGRLLPAQAGAFFRARLEAAGVRFHFNTSIASAETTSEGILLRPAGVADEGAGWHVDLVLSAVGLRPDVTLAAAAGLQVGRGIAVDQHLAASHSGVYAVGDCADVAGLNLPYVMPIMQQARALAKTLAGTATAVSYPAMPVVVKTPACPTVVCPPPAGVDGDWQETASADGVRSLFTAADGRLRGFALTGTATTEKATLATSLPPML